MTLEERRRFLKVANATRIASAEVKKEIKAGRVSLHDALHDPRAQSMKVFTLIASLPGWGKTKVRLAEIRLSPITPVTRVRDLSNHNKAVLIVRLKGLL
jgi:hypothetical protein